MSTTNIWARFKRLFPDAPLQIGTVLSVDIQTGTSMVQLIGGGILTVRGTSIASGKKAFVRDGLIEGAAPDLPGVEIEV